MISRQWWDLARSERADYVRHLKEDTFPEVAVVPQNVRAMMLEYDRRVRHYEEIGL